VGTGSVKPPEKKLRTSGVASIDRHAHVFRSALLVTMVVTALANPASAEDLPIRGVVKAINQAALSTDIPMRITRVPFREGERFKSGDLLVEFDCRRQRADLQAMKAAYREANLNLASSLSLERFKAIGRNDVEIARARLDKSKGEVASLEARLEDCQVMAPFDGRISEASVRPLEFTAAQRPYLAIIEDRNTEVEMIVSSSILASVKIGALLSFKVDELPGADVTAIITTVGAVVDPVSKSGKIVALVTSAPAALTAGMSGTAVFINAAR
jgi:membrane fusion protein, multidrug efflux system